MFRRTLGEQVVPQAAEQAGRQAGGGRPVQAEAGLVQAEAGLVQAEAGPVQAEAGRAVRAADFAAEAIASQRARADSCGARRWPTTRARSNS